MTPARIGGLFTVDAETHCPGERGGMVFAAKDAGH